MKFYLVDDMHLEFSGYRLPGDPDGILLLAGDITTPVVFKEGRTDQTALKNAPRFREFFENVSNSYKKVYYIAGNHEFYYGMWEDTRDFMRKATEGTNITVLEKEWVDLGDDVHMYGATFWTDFRKNDPIVTTMARGHMNDYRLIYTQCAPTPMYGSRTTAIGPQMVYEDHVEAFKELEEGLSVRKGKKVIVFTHHAPSLTSSHPRYGGSDNPINWAYCSEYDQFILDNPSIRYWVHGHTHDSHDYMIGGTRVLCNPRGYSYTENKVQENRKFNDKLSFEVL